MACESAVSSVSILFVYTKDTAEGVSWERGTKKGILFKSEPKIPVWVRICQFSAVTLINELQFG